MQAIQQLKLLQMLTYYILQSIIVLQGAIHVSYETAAFHKRKQSD